jgi:hypothetical protein
VLNLVVAVEKGLGVDVPGVDVGADCFNHVLAALGLGTLCAGIDRTDKRATGSRLPHRRAGHGRRSHLRARPTESSCRLKRSANPQRASARSAYNKTIADSRPVG